MFEKEREEIYQGLTLSPEEGHRLAVAAEAEVRIVFAGYLGWARRNAVLQLRRQQLTQKEIGARLGIAESTVSKLLAVARRKGEL